jgi:hypothetical protein
MCSRSSSSSVYHIPLIVLSSDTSQKSTRLLDLDSLVSQDAPSGELCDWRSKQKDMPTLVGGYCGELSYWSLFHGFLGNLSSSDPRGTAHGCRKRNGRNSSCGAVEEHVATTSGSFCAHDALVFQVDQYARSMLASLSSSLQSRPSHPSHMSHYQKGHPTSTSSRIHTSYTNTHRRSLHTIPLPVARRSFRLPMAPRENDSHAF